MSADAFTVEEYPSREAWLVGRRSSIGGSDAGVLWDAHGSRYALYADKVRGEPMEEEVDEIWQMVGHELEPGLARIYGRLTGRGIRDIGKFTILRSVAWPWMTTTLDRVGDAADREGPGMIECKVRSMFGVRRQWTEDGLPASIWAQVQHGLAVTGWTWAATAALLEGRFWHCEVMRDEEFIAAHVERCRAFWHDHVLARVQPARDGRPVTLRAVKSLYSKQSGGEVKLPPEADGWVDAIAAAKAAEEAAIKAESELRIRMGDAALGRLPSGRRVRLSAVKESDDRKGYRRLTVQPVKKGA